MIGKTSQSSNPMMTRRSALEVGVGLFGLTLPGVLQSLQASTERRSRSDISCIFLFLAGGPSQFETFDPKPEAPEGIRGDWQPMQTSVPGTHISEKLPRLARLAHKYAIIRSWQGRSGSHAAGSQHVNSGWPSASGRQYYPNFGCVISSLFGTKVEGVSPHIGLPVAARYTTPPGYLGPVHASFNIPGDPSSPDFTVPGLRLPRDRVETRESLLTQINNLSRLADSQSTSLASHDRFHDEALTTLTSGRIQRAANLQEESMALRERYGMNVYGQRVLLGRRLIEAGCRFVTINQAVQGGPYTSPNLQTAGTWDNHSDIFSFLMTFGGAPPRGRAAHSNWTSYEGPGNLPQLDISLSTLIEDLDQRGMLDTTLVVAMGEFGRTPRINRNGGRDHWPRSGCAVLAGAGVCGGALIGATDQHGATPATRPYRPEDFAASIYHALGIDCHTTYFPRLPRPTRLSEGQVIEGLFG